jgi:TonB-dependent SusC/RagA subfamily outer membrane receptor
MKGKVPAAFVVDRVMYDGDISLINPLDVAEITVLKDNAAASLYGARGFGGVVLITTKNGKGVIPPQVNSYEKSAYQYFISKSIEIRVIGKDGKTITTGVISKETDQSIFIRKKEIPKSSIEKVEIVTE